MGYGNVVKNDSDPDNNTPLKLVAIDKASGGGAVASVSSETSVAVEFGPNDDVTTFVYTVKDSLGAGSTGKLTVATNSCDAKIQPY